MKVEVIEQSIEVLTRPFVYKNMVKDLELIGRVCYKSEDKITEDSSERFIRSIIKSGHESVLEHANITIRFTTDRAMTHCLVRHRHCAFSQESTHFINYAKHDTLQVIEQEGFTSEGDAFIWDKHMENMGEIYSEMYETKALVKRSIFPSAIKTELVMTTNIRGWRHIMKIRSKDHPQMVKLMSKVIDWFKQELPIFVEDFV